MSLERSLSRPTEIHTHGSYSLGEINRKLEKHAFSFVLSQIGDGKTEYNLSIELRDLDRSTILTGNPAHVLLILCSAPEELISHRILIKEVWGLDYYGYDELNLLRVSISTIRSRLKQLGTKNTIRSVRDSGYYLSSQSS